MQPTTVYSDVYDLPNELCAKSLALVGISGLDTLNNAVHKSVWETFNSNRRLERSPVMFKLIGNDHEFPVTKPKRNSYEWYIPKGILKRNWMNKHLNDVPAVIAVFYDLEWNDSQWNEKMIECASRVQSLRAALDGRNTRIVVVLIQDIPSLPTGEDQLANERAVALCASCELNAKCLFVLTHDDHLQGYVVRLENAFYDLAQNYYHLEIRNIKLHREHLNKNTHQYLIVRHEFKMGFLHELRQDKHTAHKHYTHAYNNLTEIKANDVNGMEIRTVSGFINYKLCFLKFSLNLPRDAISQFRVHCDLFRSRSGLPDLAFEHNAWLCKQFSVFGDIFDEAVKLGLPAIQTQHPGVYYQQASQYAVARKVSCKDLCSKIETYPTPDPLENINHTEFYGQRPWRPGKLTIEPPDAQLEIRGIQALQYLEKQVNHSSIIISLYGFAISQYKTYRCPRTRRFLVVQMANEYYQCQDYGKALTLYTHMLWDYRSEPWWKLLTDILNKALNCAFLTGSISDYIMLSLELLGVLTVISMDRRKHILRNLNKIFQKQMPVTDSFLPLSEIEKAEVAWKATFCEKIVSVSLDMSNIISCIECKAGFITDKYEADQHVQVMLIVRSSCLFDITIIKALVTLNSPMRISEYVVECDKDDLKFHYNDVRKFLIEFVPDANDVGKEIQLGAINLHMGHHDLCYVDLKFSALGNDTNKICPDLIHLHRNTKNISEFEKIKPLLTTSIIPKQSQLKIVFKHSQPALLGEWYKIEITINNEEKYTVKDLNMEFRLSGDNIDETTEFSLNDFAHSTSLPMLLKIDSLQPNGSLIRVIYMRGNIIGIKNISLDIRYLMVNGKNVYCTGTEHLIVPVVKPFDIDIKFYTMNFGEISKFYVGERFIIMPTISCLSPWPIVIEDAVVIFSPDIISTENAEIHVAGKTLHNHESCSGMYSADIPKFRDNTINIGEFVTHWKREDGVNTTTQLSISGLKVEWIPLGVELPLPEYGIVRTPLLIHYKFYNKSRQLLQLQISMDASEAFMFAGFKQLQISILPESSKLLEYNLCPLIAGKVMLPKLSLTVPEDSIEWPDLRQDQLNSLIKRALPKYIFIMPAPKGKWQNTIQVA